MSPAEKELKAALLASMAINEDPIRKTHKGPTMPPPKQTEEGAGALLRMVDMRIPLPWLLSGFLIAVGSLIAMYYQVQKMTETLGDVQITVKATATQTAGITAEQALLRFRLDKLENEVAKQHAGGQAR